MTLDAIKIHDAFIKGDLDILRAVLDNPVGFPDVYLPFEFCGGYCLEYAIYHSPLSFIRTLLELGANPNYKGDDGFPSLIATISTDRQDKYEIVKLLLASGVDIQQRGANDFTPLHQAAALDDVEAIKLLLAAGADINAKTRIDHYGTALDEAILLKKLNAEKVLRKWQSDNS